MRHSTPSRARHRSQGQGLAEYSLIIIFVALVAVFALALVAPVISGIIAHATHAL